MPHTLSTNDEAALKIAAALAALDDASESFESVANGIRDHDETWYVKPSDKGYAQMAEIAIAAAKEEQEICEPVKVFDYRPFDGAHATAKVLFNVWGYAGFGKVIPATMFTPERKPQKITIAVGPEETLEIPWGHLAVPDLKAVLKLSSTMDAEKGMLFVLSVECPKLMEKSIRGLFRLIQDELEKHSIYKGKAITAAQEPEFIDLSGLNPAHIIFKEDVQQALQHEVWFPIENMDFMRADGQPTRWVTLLDGPYGTGKTLAAMLTAQRCIRPEVGITFIQVRPGKDDLKTALQTALLYSPAVVAFEDVDTAADPEKVSRDEISRLLDSFDGIRSKGVDVQIILTTNHSDKVHPGLLRAGRLNTYIKFGDLDADALRQLLSVKVGEHRLVDIDKDAIYKACQGYEPAFMDLVIQVSRRYALSRNTTELTTKLGHRPTKEQALDYKIGTIDLGRAATRLRPQHEKMQEVAGKVAKDDFRRLWIELSREAMHGMPVFDESGPVGGGWHLHNDADRIAEVAAK